MLHNYEPSAAARYEKEHREPMPEMARCFTCTEIVEAATLSYDNLCHECQGKCYNCGETGGRLTFVDAIGYNGCDDCIGEALKLAARRPVRLQGDLDFAGNVIEMDLGTRLRASLKGVA